MQSEADGWSTAAIVAVMALVTLATRWGGVCIMAFVPIGPRVTRFVSAMSGSVLIALIAPMALGGDWAARAALATTMLLIIVLKKPLPAIAAGIVAAALIRQF